ncbi:MAG: NADH-quinone oxidoreductase subunit M [Deltaproteobacteria bacterium]|nr:NADH-quinone oxidoreductase subunit M [Deltaproteobacteria bacterium]
MVPANVLSIITFLPLVGALVVLCIPSSQRDAIRYTAVLATAVPFLLTLMMLPSFNPGAGTNVREGLQFIENYAWITTYGIRYHVGVDGLSMPLVVLTGLVALFSVIASWGITKAIKAYFALLLFLTTGMYGVFVALDFFLFYVFWEVMLLPMYFLIGIWGGPRKEYAAIKFFLYTLAGSVLMLLALIALYLQSSPNTFDLLELMAQHKSFTRNFSAFGYIVPLSKVLFVGLFIGFAIKVPCFPFHTWLPDAHVEAPTPVSVILAAVLLKMGTYGIMRICLPLLPDAALWFAPTLALLGVINIVYGALCAMAQTDMKKLVAYSSVSHMGYCLLAIAASNEMGLTAASFQMFSHGIVSAQLFLLVGVIYDRAHHRQIDGFGGIAQQMPVYTAFAGLAFFANLGLPGLIGFPGEALTFLSAFKPFMGYTVIAITGVILTAAFCLWMLQRVFLGPKNPKYDTLPEITLREKLTLVPFAVLTILFGFYPAPLFKLMNPAMVNLASWLRP